MYAESSHTKHTRHVHAAQVLSVILRQICFGLTYLYLKKIVHRDMKVRGAGVRAAECFSPSDDVLCLPA
jgi:hypothetical protein